ncbi:class I adenylate-forming enzyme family protein [Tomitella cavernea]|uniref:class I adenylate-forming enzyme family protein n=1 Tax=Tomitella cavernea TaxID=1387982 RepID=UPI001903C6C1|nr:class I adenylate-forming enzyme family protein [Tomitella cavernea]
MADAFGAVVYGGCGSSGATVRRRVRSAPRCAPAFEEYYKMDAHETEVATYGRTRLLPPGTAAGGMNLARLLEESAGRGDAEYLVAGGRRVGFRENHARVHALATVLRREYGIGRGDRVAILAANGIPWITAFWAVAVLGGVAVAMNSRWAAPEVVHALGLTEPGLVLADERRRGLVPRTGDGAVPVCAIESVDAMVADGAGGVVSSGMGAQSEDPATILFTSGTTGRAKGVVHPHRSLIATADHQRLPRVDDPAPRRYLLATPLFHVAALHNLTVPRLALGDTAVLWEGRFDIDGVTRLIDAESVTHWSAVPTMASRLLDLLESRPATADRLRTLRGLSLITAPAAPAMQDRLRALVPVARTGLAATYGLTETACPVTAATDADLAADPLCVGTPVPRMEVQIRDGRHRSAGVGEIWSRGPHLMSGYWRDREATGAAFDADGWLRTGDLGEFVDGRLRVHSRRTDLIIRGGENVYPAEVEAVVESHPAVAECMVYGAAHPDWGQEVCAVMVPAGRGSGAEGAVPTLTDDLARFVSERLAAYKVPVRWLVRDAPLPRNASGKVVRGEVLQNL